MSQIVPVRLSAELLAGVDRRASLEASNRPSVIRAALEAYLVGDAGDRGLSDSVRSQVAEISEKYGVSRLDIFGSIARGEASASSDIDLLYTLHPGVRLGWDIEDLAAELGAVLGRRVDLVSRSGLHPRLRDAVLAEAQVLYAA